MASFLGRHGKKQSMLPALRVVHAARAGQLPVNARGEVLGSLGLPETHGAIMPPTAVAGKGASDRGTSKCLGNTFTPHRDSVVYPVRETLHPSHPRRCWR
jgi:hypothetical protein